MPPPGWQPPPAAPAAVAQPRLNPNEERWEHKRSTGAVERALGLDGAAAQLMVGPADLVRRVASASADLAARHSKPSAPVQRFA